MVDSLNVQIEDIGIQGKPQSIFPLIQSNKEKIVTTDNTPR